MINVTKIKFCSFCLKDPGGTDICDKITQTEFMKCEFRLTKAQERILNIEIAVINTLHELHGRASRSALSKKSGIAYSTLYYILNKLKRRKVVNNKTVIKGIGRPTTIWRFI